MSSFMNYKDAIQLSWRVEPFLDIGLWHAIRWSLKHGSLHIKLSVVIKVFISPNDHLGIMQNEVYLSLLFALSISLLLVIVLFFEQDPLCNCCMNAGHKSLNESLLTPTSWSIPNTVMRESKEKHWNLK